MDFVSLGTRGTPSPYQKVTTVRNAESRDPAKPYAKVTADQAGAACCKRVRSRALTGVFVISIQ